MSRIASSLLLLLCAGLAHAQEQEPPLEGNLTAVVIFAVLFVVFCVGLVWFLWKQHKSGSGKDSDSEASGPPS